MAFVPTLRASLPRLAHQLAAPHAKAHLPFAAFRLSAPPQAAGAPSRLFSSFPNRSSLPEQLFSKRFSGSSDGIKYSGSRGIASAPVYGESGRQQVDWTKVATNVGLAAVGAIGLNYALNRETRGALSAAESSYLHSTFGWTAGGLTITATVAKLLHSNGYAIRLMQLNPWVFMGVGLAASVGSMMGVYYTAPDSPAHYASWAVFSALQGVTLSPMFFLNPAILSRAGLYTLGALGGLSYVGVTAESEKFLYIGGPLLAGLGVVLVSSLAPMILPRMAMRTMSILEHVSAYGGVAVFSGFILYDTQKILKHAKLAEVGAIPRDPIRESVSLILDAINLFVRIVQVMMLQQRKK